MVRLKGKNDLGELAGKLSSSFHAVNLTALHTQFITAVADPDKKVAAQALDDFYAAAKQVCTSEMDFNRRARPHTTSSLMTHMRAPTNFSAIRAFNAAKKRVMDIHPDLGRSIVQQTERNINNSTRTATRRAAMLA